MTYSKRPLKSAVVELVFNIPPTAKVIWRLDFSLKSHPKDWRSPQDQTQDS